VRDLGEGAKEVKMFGVGGAEGGRR